MARVAALAVHDIPGTCGSSSLCSEGSTGRSSSRRGCGGCGFCVDLNAAAALERGAARERLQALDAFESSPLFSERECAALGYAEAMTDSARRVDEAAFERLREHFDEQAILELTARVAFQNLSSKFNAALSVPSQGFCQMRGA